VQLLKLGDVTDVPRHPLLCRWRSCSCATS
jgi:hypothetical protein